MVNQNTKPESEKKYFDRTDEYNSMLNQGLKVTGENKMYFVNGRVRAIESFFLPNYSPSRILDFGCGIGDTSAFLSNHFSKSQIIGVDTSENAVEFAAREYGNHRLSFYLLDEIEAIDLVDFVHINGVFHHIPPAERLESAKLIDKAVVPGGYIAIFDNNPWSLPARIVMSRIPFDKDAIMISATETSQYFRKLGYQIIGVRYLFIFPAIFSVLRKLEPLLSKFPFGAQYLLLAHKPN